MQRAHRAGDRAIIEQHGDEAPGRPWRRRRRRSRRRCRYFRLSGIASNTENGVAVLTAIVIDNGAMVLREGGR